MRIHREIRIWSRQDILVDGSTSMDRVLCSEEEWNEDLLNDRADKSADMTPMSVGSVGDHDDHMPGTYS